MRESEDSTGRKEEGIRKQGEIILKNTNPETSAFYRRLKLRVSQLGDSIKLRSTSTTKIKSFDGVLKLDMTRSYLRRLTSEKTISIEHCSDKEPTYRMNDNIGTTILVSLFNSNNTRIGVLTSGGDSPGMNSAVRSVVMSSLKNNIRIFGIYRGFDGLIRGDIRSLGWDSETKESGQGGTCLLSARSERFKSREGRKEAALNLFIRNINALVVIGGEGTMEGAMVLRNEFKDLVRELIEDGKITEKIIEDRRIDRDLCKRLIRTKLASSSSNSSNSTKSSLSTENVEDILIEYSDSESNEEFDYNIENIYDLKIIGIPGTIDNDLIGTDFSLGCNTAITRVAEIVDKLTTTMKSHKRVFVVECMGRSCGWITLMAGFAVEAEYIFIPEAPVKNWREEMMRSLKTAYYNHKLNIIVLVCEGAVDLDGRTITTREIESIIKGAGLEVRSLVLGHIQRGGMTTSQDRIFGTMAGIKAVEHIIEGSYFSNNTEYKGTDCMANGATRTLPVSSDTTDYPVMIASVNNEIMAVDLRTIVKNTEKSKNLFKCKKFNELFEMRSENFQHIYRSYEDHRQKIASRFFREHLYPREYSIGHLHASNEKKLKSTNDVLIIPAKKKIRVGVLSNGESCCGMNVILNGLVQSGVAEDVEVFYFFDGFVGFRNNRLRKADIFEFSLYTSEGGIAIGRSDDLTHNTRISYSDDQCESKMDELGLNYLIIIGNTTNLRFTRNNPRIILIPATISNNMPCTDISIGSETAVNAIQSASEVCKFITPSIGNRVFMVEVGGSCGFLTVMSGIASSVFEVIHPEYSKVEDLAVIRNRIRMKFEENSMRPIIIFRSRNTFSRVSTESLCKILCSEIGASYDYSILGHMERGSVPSVIDRINARLLAFKTIEHCKSGAESCKVSLSGIVGIRDFKAVFTDIEKVFEGYDEEKDCEKDARWLKYSRICSLLE